MGSAADRRPPRTVCPCAWHSAPCPPAARAASLGHPSVVSDAVAGGGAAEGGGRWRAKRRAHSEAMEMTTQIIAKTPRQTTGGVVTSTGGTACAAAEARGGGALDDRSRVRLENRIAAAPPVHTNCSCCLRGSRCRSRACLALLDPCYSACRTPGLSCTGRSSRTGGAAFVDLADSASLVAQLDCRAAPPSRLALLASVDTRVVRCARVVRPPAAFCGEGEARRRRRCAARPAHAHSHRPR